MNKTTSSFLIVGIIVLSLIIGGVAGVFYQKQKDSPKVELTTKTINSLSSKVVSAIVTYGTVKSIDNNRNITLSYKGDEMTIGINSDAKVYIYENSVKKEVQFQDIKVGDMANITTNVSPDGKFQGTMVVIFARATVSSK